MRLLIRLAVLFYVTTILFIGSFLLLFVFQIIDLQLLVGAITFAYQDTTLRIILGLVAGIFLVKNFIYAQAISDRKQREKTVAFDNPSGRVTVSLMAMEDLVRRVALANTDVKDIKTNIVASRKGRLDVFARLTLQSDVNIPDVTSALQETIRKKIQDTMGVEEPVVVRIHVARIVASDPKSKAVERTQFERTVPFQGYRA